MSLPYGRPLFLTFEMFFSLLLSLPLFPSISHSLSTHTHTILPVLPTSQPLRFLSLKDIAFQAWIKQMGLRKHCCSLTQHLGLSTDSPHALQHSPLNVCTQRHTRFLERKSPAVDGCFSTCGYCVAQLSNAKLRTLRQEENILSIRGHLFRRK